MDDDEFQWPDEAPEVMIAADEVETGASNDENFVTDSNGEKADSNHQQPPLAATAKNTAIKQKSWVWDFFTIEIDQKDKKEKARCLLCKTKSKFLVMSATTSLSYHLTHAHKKTCPEDPSTSSSPNVAPNTMAKFTRTLSKEKIALITRAITNFMAWDLYPMNLAMGRGFRSLMKLLEPRYTIPHRTTFIRTHIPVAYQEMRAQVAAKLKNAIRVCLTTDMWTDDYRHCSYMAVTAHFVSDEWIFESFCLSTKLFTEKQTAANLAEALSSVATEWDLKFNKFVVVTDGGANI
ncbi:E3 SUMO-protein ligase ZBED1-like [Daphnia magna]|uniref:E3 SUMO-protein ligase ZBED1-like n=1 Tax=Daphnia magna TaxID=35525 RepID=UPI001E1BB91D|nr:E3 SUMO-protein ligase ZBED1-like [Daphnia magna]